MGICSMQVKESIIFTRGKRNILGQAVILVLEKTQGREPTSKL
jgi:hypothetical protein